MGLNQIYSIKFTKLVYNSASFLFNNLLQDIIFSFNSLLDSQYSLSFKLESDFISIICI